MIEVKEITNKETWETAVAQFPEVNFLHSWNWGEFHHRLGKTIYRTGYFKGDTLKGVMLSIVEKAKRATYLTVPGGPLLSWNDAEVVKVWKQSLVDRAKAHHASFVRVRPQLLETPQNAALFAGLDFRLSPMHLHAELTHQLDLTKSEEELLAAMRKTTRQEVNHAAKLGLEVTTSHNPEMIDGFYKLQLETARRQGFVPFGQEFIKTQFSVFAADNQAELYTVKHKNKILVQAIIMFYGLEADYHYSVSTEESRKFPAAYALQWQAIRDAKARGFKRYNLWGVAPENDTHHRFYGVSVFKRGFRGEDVAYLHARDLVVDPLRYTANWIVEIVRKKFRKV